MSIIIPIVETKKAVEEKKEYRVTSHPFTFKTGSSILKPSIEGIYTPKSKEDTEFLDWQVKKQNISYS